MNLSDLLTLLSPTTTCGKSTGLGDTISILACAYVLENTFGINLDDEGTTTLASTISTILNNGPIDNNLQAAKDTKLITQSCSIEELNAARDVLQNMVLEYKDIDDSTIQESQGLARTRRITSNNGQNKNI